MSTTQHTVLREEDQAALHLLTPIAGGSAELPCGCDAFRLPMQPRSAPLPLSSLSHSITEADAFGFALDANLFDPLLEILPTCIEAAQKLAMELRLTPEELRKALDGLVEEVERRGPQIVNVLLIIALLPVIQARAFKKFRYKHDESHHDAEDMSQSMAQNILVGLTGAWPRGNVAAWLATIADHARRDHWRKRHREELGLERLEHAFHALRK